MHAEHFGISVVEAMSRDAVPVVYMDGGVWEDIVEWGKFGCGYTTIEEAVEAVELALRRLQNSKANPDKGKATLRPKLPRKNGETFKGV